MTDVSREEAKNRREKKVVTDRDESLGRASKMREETDQIGMLNIKGFLARSLA